MTGFLETTWRSCLLATSVKALKETQIVDLNYGKSAMASSFLDHQVTPVRRGIAPFMPADQCQYKLVLHNKQLIAYGFIEVHFGFKFICFHANWCGKCSCLIYYILLSRRQRETYIGHARLCVCLSLCCHMPTLLQCTDPDVTWGGMARGAPSCALLGGFAIGVRVSML